MELGGQNAPKRERTLIDGLCQLGTRQEAIRIVRRGVADAPERLDLVRALQAKQCAARVNNYNPRKS